MPVSPPASFAPSSAGQRFRARYAAERPLRARRVFGRPFLVQSVFGPFLLLLLLATSGPAHAQTVPGFDNPAGYTARALGLFGSAFAVGPDGKFALAEDDFSGQATITVYDQFGPGRTVLKTFAAPTGDTFQFFGGIAWRDANTFAFSENGGTKTAFLASLTDGGVTPLAPSGSLPYVAQIAFRPGDPQGALFAGLANGPGQNAVFKVAGGSVTPFATGLGTGYLGGLAFRPDDGALFVGDTNDPNFAGNPGQVERLDASGALAATISLSGGGGSGISGLTFDAASDLFATTGGTISKLAFGASVALPFGRFTGPAPFGYFPGDLAFVGGAFGPNSGGTGTLLVNGGFTNAPGLFALQPAAVPEPSGLAAAGLALAGLAGLGWRRAKRNGPKPGDPKRRQANCAARGSVRTGATLLLAVAALSARAQYATTVLAYDSAGANASFTDAGKALGPPSTRATPTVPDNAAVVSVGQGGYLVLGFDGPIIHRPSNPSGLDFTVFGNAFYVGGDIHVRYQKPGIVEAGIFATGAGFGPSTVFYRLQGSADPTSGYPASGVDDRLATTYGYACVTPTDGTGDPQIASNPFQSGITPGSAGGDSFSLAWAVDGTGAAVTLDHADCLRIHSAASQPYTVIDAVALVRPTLASDARLPRQTPNPTRQ